MKIHYLTDIYLGAVTGDTTRTVEIIKCMEQTHKVYVICSSTHLKFKRMLEIPTLKFNKLKRLILFNLFYPFLYLVYFLLHKPDVIYQRVDGSLLIPLSAILSKLFKVPLVIEINGDILYEIEVRNEPSIYLKAVAFSEKMYCKQASKIICVTPGLKTLIRERYQLKDNTLIVIPNGVNTEIFKPLHKNKLTRSIIFEGYLLPIHGLETLLNALKIVLSSTPCIKLFVIGDGPEKEKLIDMADTLEISNNVIFLPAVPQSTLSKLINLGDICIAPFTEKRNNAIGISPMKIFEYMACGKPIISSRINNLEEIEEYKTGVLIDPDDPQKLAETIITMMKSPEELLQMGENGRLLIERKYSWGKIGAMIMEAISV